MRIQLKAIEVQSPPAEALDADLRQSIQNWKDDWASLRSRRAVKTLATKTTSSAAEMLFDPRVSVGSGRSGSGRVEIVARDGRVVRASGDGQFGEKSDSDEHDGHDSDEEHSQDEHEDEFGSSFESDGER